MKHYIDIERFKVKYDTCLRPGDEIIVEEKIDEKIIYFFVNTHLIYER
jgi:hypothetical protein